MKTRYLSVMFIALLWLSVTASGQSLTMAVPAPATAVRPKAEVPRQLSLERAEEILLQNNLTLTAARYGIEIARAQRLTASLRPNPTLTFGAEQFDIGHPLRNLVSTASNSAANRV